MRILFALSCLISLSFASLSSIYDYSFTTIEGIQTSLNSYQGKKIIILTLPISQNTENNIYLQRLDSLSKAHQGNVVMIGVPSFEDGYSIEGSNNLKTWYRSILDSQFLISKGLHTRKSSSQEPLFKWLTDKDLNRHFDLDVEGAGQQFFISETGNLYGVIDPEARMSNKIFNKLIQ
jgi:glutathione peroxidase